MLVTGIVMYQLTNSQNRLPTFDDIVVMTVYSVKKKEVAVSVLN